MSEYRKINPEFKAKWVAALRSGEYRQGHRRLRTVDDCFCCLGVAADIINPSSWFNPFLSTALTWSWKDEEWSAVLPVDTCNSINLDQPAHDKLCSMNDNGYSFTDIADWIEENL